MGNFLSWNISNRVVGLLCSIGVYEVAHTTERKEKLRQAGEPTMALPPVLCHKPIFSECYTFKTIFAIHYRSPAFSASSIRLSTKYQISDRRAKVITLHHSESLPPHIKLNFGNIFFFIPGGQIIIYCKLIGIRADL